MRLVAKLRAGARNNRVPAAGVACALVLIAGLVALNAVSGSDSKRVETIVDHSSQEPDTDSLSVGPTTTSAVVDPSSSATGGPTTGGTTGGTGATGSGGTSVDPANPATEATASGGLRVTVTPTTAGPGNVHLAIRIQDTSGAPYILNVDYGPADGHDGFASGRCASGRSPAAFDKGYGFDHTFAETGVHVIVVTVESASCVGSDDGVEIAAVHVLASS
jgi:hypothetical protein